MNPEIYLFLKDGCGRCSLYKTPKCKVHTWQEELKKLRLIIQGTELTEELKWKQPCYTYDGSNVLIVSCFKDYAFVSFFKGSLLDDPENLLVQPGEHSQAVRQLRFTNVDEITAQENVIEAFIKQAIEVEKKGLKVDFSQNKKLDFPEELLQKFEDDPMFQEAFENLTPGRQRSWNLYYTGAKQSQTKINRIERSIPKIFEGKGWNER